MDVKVSAAKQIRGSVRTAGDKSVSHRYAMLAGIAEGTSEFENFSTSADCASTLACMEALGAGCGATAITWRWMELAAALQAPARELDCGNSGSTMRMLSGVVAAQPFTSVMIGDASLSKRPMRRVIEPLQKDGREDRIARRLRAADDPWREAEGDGVSAAGGERAGEELRAAGRAVRRGRDHGDRAGAHARPHRAGAAGIRRRGACATATG